MRELLERTAMAGFSIEKVPFRETAEAGVLVGFEVGLGRFLRDEVVYDEKAVAKNLKGRAGEVLQTGWAIDGPVVVPWRSGAALAALGTGERQRALELSAADVDLARADGIPVGLARTLRARGLVVGDEDGLALLREAAAAAAASESVLEQTHAGVELGAALRRSGARREARTILAEARERAESSGLGALAQRARDEQQASGARPRRVSLTGPAALTPSELRIARLAAAGATNQQIAAELHLSPKTVSWHLGAIFRKLAITRRQALAAALEGDRA